MLIEEIDIESLGSSFDFEGINTYSDPVHASFKEGLLVTASTGEANIYLKADIENSTGKKVHIICFFEEDVDRKLRNKRDENWSPEPIPFSGKIEGYLSDWVKGVGLTLHNCRILNDDT
jgi:hypothetical protein